METEHDKQRLPNNQPIDYRQIRVLRVLRNKTQRDFAELVGIPNVTLCALERGKRPFTPYYEEKVRKALKRLSVTNEDIVSTRQLINYKSKRGYPR